MKFLKYCVSAIFVLLISFCTHFDSSAMNTGFILNEITDEEAQRFIENIKLTSLSTEPDKIPIYSFDVNEKGMIVIGHIGSASDRVTVYSDDGKFQYGFVFETYGSYAVGWDGDNVIIYFVRSDLAVSLTKNGDVVEILEIDNNSENNSYWRDVVYSRNRTAKNVKYEMSNDAGLSSSSFSKIVATYDNGEKRTVYDATPSKTIGTIFEIGVPLLFVTIAIVGVINIVKRQNGDIQRRDRKSP